MIAQKKRVVSSHNDHALRVLGIVKSEEVRTELFKIFHDIPKISSELVIANLSETLIEQNAQANIILLEVDKADSGITDTIQILKDSGKLKHKRLIVVYRGLSDGDILDLLHCGVNDFLSFPLSVEQTKQTILRLVSNGEKKHKDVLHGKVFTFVHASGGVGCTTLAVNTAVALNSSKKVSGAACLLDFDLQFGSAYSHLDLGSYSPFDSLFDNPESFDRSMFEGMLQKHSSGLSVLTSPEVPFPVDALNNDLVKKILTFSQNDYQYSVIDMPITVTDWTDAVLKHSDAIFAVINLNVPHITQIKRWLNMLDNEGLSDLPVKIVVNKYHPSGLFHHEHVTLQQAQAALGREILCCVPEDTELILTSLDEGLPATLAKPHCKFSEAIKDLYENVLRDEKHALHS